MLVRYWQTAVIAVIMALTGNAVWAQQSSGAQSGCIGCRFMLYKGQCSDSKDCCAAGDCCKEGKCCKNADGCKSGKCGKCGKDNKCECTTGGDCCCKKGECNCKKTSCGKGTCCGSCQTKQKNIVQLMKQYNQLMKQYNQLYKEAKYSEAEKVALRIKELDPDNPMADVAITSARLHLHKDECDKAYKEECFLKSMHDKDRAVSGAGTKSTTIIVVMPPALPMCGCGVYHAEPAEAMMHAPMPIPPGMILTHPLPMLAPPQMAALPPLPPPPPCYTCPMSSAPCAAAQCPIAGCLSSLMSMASDLCCHLRPLNVPSLCAPAMGLCSPPYVHMAPPSFPLPRELASQEACSPCPMFTDVCYGCRRVECIAAKPTVAAQLHVNARPSGNELEMSFDDGTRIRCKKMTVTIGEKDITLSRFDDRVRVRGEELKATAASVRSDRKDHLILEGDVVLHYKK
ncbi:MAG: hypothetical protein ACRELF_15635, partial [Gemmataceae bacterium]